MDLCLLGAEPCPVESGVYRCHRTHPLEALDIYRSQQGVTSLSPTRPVPAPSPNSKHLVCLAPSYWRFVGMTNCSWFYRISPLFMVAISVSFINMRENIDSNSSSTNSSSTYMPQFGGNIAPVTVPFKMLAVSAGPPLWSCRTSGGRAMPRCSGAVTFSLSAPLHMRSSMFQPEA